MKTEVLLAFIFGVVFLLIALVFALVAFYLPKPANPGIVENFLFVMQVILAISASGVAAIIPGFLNVNIKNKLGDKGTFGIRAGGAIAVFVLVFLVNPKSIALDKLNERVAYDERLVQCMSFVAASGSPMSEALPSCETVVSVDSLRWEAYRQLGRIYFWYKEYPEAISNYKKSISLLVGTEYDQVTRVDQVPSRSSRDFAQMSSSIAMAYVGLANTRSTDTKEKIETYKKSLAAAEKIHWFVKAAVTPTRSNQSFNDLIYLEAINHAYIWITDKSLSVEAPEFDTAVGKFNDFLALKNSVPQWAEYHLACLYAEAFDRTSNSVYSAKARAFVASSLRNLLRLQNDKTAVQNPMMKCRLRLEKPEDCEEIRGSEPMICLNVAKLVSGDSEIASLMPSR